MSDEESEDKPLHVYKYVPCRKPKRLHGMEAEEDDQRDDNTTYIEIAIVGEANVGKTSILKRFAERQFDGTRNPTPGIEFINAYIMSNAPLYDRKTSVSLVDTAGQEQYAAVVPQRLRSPYGVFFVFDATKRKTFDALSHWHTIVSNNNDFCCRMLVANKMDLYKLLPEEQRWMDQLDWPRESDRLQCDEGFFCVSAMNGDNVDSMIVEMVDYAIERQNELEQEALKADLDADTRRYTTTSGVVNISNSITYKQNKASCKC